MALTAASLFHALREDASRFGVTVSAAQAETYERFATLLLERNTSVNLTAITAPADVARKHVLDSLTALAVRRWSGTERVIDVGTGAGFPGLALRIALPGIRLTLVESVGKKARFLEEAVGTLGLTGVDVQNARAEELAAVRRASYDIGLARAVTTIGGDLEYLLPFLAVGGEAIIWKGRIDLELPGARAALADLGGELTALISTESLGVGDLLPGRNLVVARKTRRTPERYPRRAVEARRRPW